MNTPPGSSPPMDEKVIYEQLCNDFRSLNGFLWQTPLIFMTMTGGLWFAVGSFEMTVSARSWLMIFAGLANLIMIAALFRLRVIMQRLLNKIQVFDGRPAVGPNYFIVSCFSFLLLLAAIGSFAASCNPSAWFSKAAAQAEVHLARR
jgi:hypothetical protein